MKLRYYSDTNSAYVKFNNVPGVRTLVVVDGVNVDLGADDEVVGIEFEYAAKHLDATTMEEERARQEAAAQEPQLQASAD